MAKRKIAWSLEAKKDLLNILEFFIERNGTAVYSRKLFKKINRTIKLISKNPAIGVQTDYDSVRTVVMENYQVIYEVFDKEILIIMLWDCSQNPEEKLIDKRIN
jgi:plasmid stabilization system protein ParE